MLKLVQKTQFLVLLYITLRILVILTPTHFLSHWHPSKESPHILSCLLVNLELLVAVWKGATEWSESHLPVAIPLKKVIHTPPTHIYKL